jgi:hypothetical protein
VGGAFVSEDLALGRPPTVVTPEWLNAVQSELIAVIGIRGGEQPNKGDNGQLARAILAAMGNLSGVASNPASGPLTAPHAGKITYVDLTVRPSVQLSSAPDIPLGSVFTICAGSGSGTFTIAPPAGGYISFGSFHPGVNVPITMRNEDVVALARVSELTYAVVSGGLSASPAGAAVLTGAGWQRLPSGLILQWGSVSVAATTVAFNYPTSFPNNVFHISGSPVASTVGGAGHPVFSAGTLSGATVSPWGTGNYSVRWFAIGN